MSVEVVAVERSAYDMQRALGERDTMQVSPISVCLPDTRAAFYSSPLAAQKYSWRLTPKQFSQEFGERQMLIA